MIMKLNWGTGILITIIIFLIGMITLVIISSMQPLNLVTPDYYPKGIDFQSQINSKNRADALDKGIEFSQDKDYIYIQFPMIDSLHYPEGDVLLFRPANNRSDRTYKISTGNKLLHTISKDSLFTGRCIIKVEWKVDTLSYYHEEAIMLY